MFKNLDWIKYYDTQSVKGNPMSNDQTSTTSMHKPPTRFIRKPRNTEQNSVVSPILPMLRCEAAARPVEDPVHAGSEMKTSNVDRSQYNRLIGEMIRQDIECYCDDLPCLDQVACFQELDLNLSERKN